MPVIRILISGLSLVAPASLATRASAHSPLTLSGADNGSLVIDAGAGLAVAVLTGAWALYCIGLRRRAASRGRVLAFHSGMALALFTVAGPLDHWAEANAALHMTQHMLMIGVIPPLWVLARPLPQWNAATANYSGLIWTPLLRAARYPMLAASLHAAVIWAWHVPRLYLLALDNIWWHLAEHVCFLLSAGLFWWSVLHSGPRVAPHALLALLFTLMHTGLLGGLLTFAGQSLYGESRALQHQQLAGLIMWVPGAIPYLVATVWCGLRWFNQMLRRTA